MADTTFLDWPFFTDAHRTFARGLDAWSATALRSLRLDHSDADAACRTLVRALGDGGWLSPAVAVTGAPLDVRTLCLARETLARHEPLADFAFAMQGLGGGPISLFGSEAQRSRHLARVGSGDAIAAFALSEPDAGSDVMRMTTTAVRDSDGAWRIDGEKTWISNGGIADVYVVFARWPEGGDRAFVALVVEAGTPGFTVVERLHTVAPHPLARLRFEGCKVGADALVGEAGRGMRVALGTLDVFRSTVGAAALGFARRALDEALGFTSSRRMFDQRLADFQLTQARLAQMATDVDTSALLVYRAAWAKDAGAERVTREAAMAKWHATEAAQRTIDAAVQLHGARGVQVGSIVERLYREIRSLRIYEGTSEVQQLVIAGQILPAGEKRG